MRLPDSPAARWWLPLTLVLGACPGLFVWVMAFHKGLSKLTRYQPSAEAMAWLMAAVCASMALFVGAAHGYGVRRQRLGEAPAIAMGRLNRCFLPLLALPAIPALFLDSIETHWPELALSLAAWMGFVAMAWTWSLPLLRLGTTRPWAPRAALAALIVAYAGIFSTFAVFRHHSLITGIKDLGIYDSIFWHTLRGDLLGANFVKTGNHAAAHVDPILILLSPLYLLYPRAETLLVLQTVWLASGALPLYLLARHKLDAPWTAVALAAIYLLYPALHGTNLFDFHSLALIAPLLLWAIYFLETRQLRRYAVALALLLLCREDVSLLCCGLGLWVIATGRGTRLGLATIGASAIYLVFVKLVIMPDPNLLMAASARTYSYASFYSGLIPNGRGGVGTLLTTLFTRPDIVLHVVFTPDKLLFFLELFLPLLFIPLFGTRRAWVLLLYGFAFLFLASRTEVFSLDFQYPVVLYPLALALVPLSLAEIPRWRLVRALGLDAPRLGRALVTGMLVVTVAISARFGALAPNRAFRPGKQGFTWEMTPAATARYAWVRQAVATIPQDASVSATFRLGPHISNRQRATAFEEDRSTDYLLLDTSRLEDKAQKAYDRVVASKSFVLLSKDGWLELWMRAPKAGR